MEQKEKARTPEERLDRAILEDNLYFSMIWVLCFLFVGIELFGCLMPIQLNVSLLIFFCTTLVTLILYPLLFETRGNRVVRRIAVLGYFPVRRKEFIMSKGKIALEYVRVFWPAVGIAEVLTVVFFDMQKFLISMLVIPAACLFAAVLWLLIGTVGIKFSARKKRKGM